jgi:hypothetical protein
MERIYEQDDRVSQKSGHAGAAMMIVLAAIMIGATTGIMIASQNLLPGLNERTASLIPENIVSKLDNLKAKISGIVGGSDKESHAETEYETISTGLISVDTIHYSPQPNSAQMMFDLEDMQLIGTGRLSGPDRVYVDLQNIHWEQDSFKGIKTLKALDIDGDLVSRVRIKKRESGVTRIVLDLTQCCDFTYKIPQQSPSRLIVSLRPV